jgi:hypothetical protein
LRLQRKAGNRAVTRLLQRDRGKDAIADDVEAWGADHTEASTYVVQYYERIRAFLDEKEKAQAMAEGNFKSFKDLKDPPSLGLAMFKSIFRSVVGMIPGGAALLTGIEVGSFISDGTGGHDEAAKDEKAKDGGEPAEHAEGGGKLEQAKELGMKGVEGGKEVYATFTETKAKKREAEEAEENAKLFQHLSSQRISSWADLTSRAFAEEKGVLAWLGDMQRSHKHRGGLVALVKSKLGPQLPDGVSSEISLEMARACELELFRKWFKEKKAAIVGVGYWGHQDLGAFSYTIEIGGEESQRGERIPDVVRRHLIDDIFRKLPTKYLPGYVQDLVNRWGWDILYDDGMLGRALGLHGRTWMRYVGYDGPMVVGDSKEQTRVLSDYTIETEQPELRAIHQRMRKAYLGWGDER